MLRVTTLYACTAASTAARLVLVGDPHQLQAVSRGGMFAELCAAGRTVELDTIHRFRHDWEAAASLKLRHGDPAGLTAYLAHDRIIAGPLGEHVERIVTDWAEHHAHGLYTAITTTTNDHVDAINRAIQQHRLDIGQLDDTALDLGDRSFHVGDIVATRRNDRQLRTTTGEMVRNRDYWTIDGVTVDGGLAVTRIDGHGTIILPPDYVGGHVQLGYAATEPGNQAETADRSLTLATPATTGRGLYVAVTRGRDDNLILVVTDTHDLGEALDTLEQILATDRADTPAIGVRRELATAVPPPPALHPGSTIPRRFHNLYNDVIAELAQARARIVAQQLEAAHAAQRITEVNRQLQQLDRRCAPHDRAIANVERDLEHARQRHRQSERDLANSRHLRRRTARRAVADAAAHVDTVQTALTELTQGAQALLQERQQLRSKLDNLDWHVNRVLKPTNDLDHYRLQAAENTVNALDTWNSWAAGRSVHPRRLTDAADHLRDSGHPDHAALVHSLDCWLDQHGVTQPRSSVERATMRTQPPGIEIDF